MSSSLSSKLEKNEDRSPRRYVVDRGGGEGGEGGGGGGAAAKVHAVNTGPKGVINDYRQSKENQKEIIDVRKRGKDSERRKGAAKSRPRPAPFTTSSAPPDARGDLQVRWERAKSRGRCFGSLLKLHWEAVYSHVTNEDSGFTTFILFYALDNESGLDLERALVQMASKRPELRFCSVECPEGKVTAQFGEKVVDEEALPLIAMYKEGRTAATFERVDDLLQGNISFSSLELFLLKEDVF